MDIATPIFFYLLMLLTYSDKGEPTLSQQMGYYKDSPTCERVSSILEQRLSGKGIRVRGVCVKIAKDDMPLSVTQP